MKVNSTTRYVQDAIEKNRRLLDKKRTINVDNSEYVEESQEKAKKRKQDKLISITSNGEHHLDISKGEIVHC